MSAQTSFYGLHKDITIFFSFSYALIVTLDGGMFSYQNYSFSCVPRELRHHHRVIFRLLLLVVSFVEKKANQV